MESKSFNGRSPKLRVFIIDLNMFKSKNYHNRDISFTPKPKTVFFIKLSLVV
jgi:hypothetical protein